jgi:hypothetical protein
MLQLLENHPDMRRMGRIKTRVAVWVKRENCAEN